MKQRLIGAAVLVALAVILVPMLLEAPEPEATPAGALPLDVPPRPDQSLQTREVPLALPPAAPPSAATPMPAAADRVVTVDAESAPRQDALAAAPAANQAKAPPAATAVLPSTRPPAATPAATPAEKPSATPPAAKPASPAPAAASQPVVSVPAAAPTPTPTPAAVGRFVVNLGTFGNEGNATALRQRLQASGLPILTEGLSVDGKPARRLRAGPYRSRAEAEAALLRIAKAEPGLKPTLGELDVAVALPASAPPRVASGFAVQVGALKDEAEANALRDRIRGAGMAAYVERAQTDAGVLWRVRAGPELQRARAEALRDRLKQALKLDGLVVSHP